MAVGIGGQVTLECPKRLLTILSFVPAISSSVARVAVTL